MNLRLARLRRPVRNASLSQIAALEARTGVQADRARQALASGRSLLGLSAREHADWALALGLRAR